jgi:hypothetical protein
MSVPIRPPASLQAIWDRAAIAAMTSIMQTDPDLSVAEVVAMAAECGDLFIEEWRVRFDPKKERAGAAAR